VEHVRRVHGQEGLVHRDAGVAQPALGGGIEAPGERALEERLDGDGVDVPVGHALGVPAPDGK
jgi:hypothetical protein